MLRCRHGHLNRSTIESICHANCYRSLPHGVAGQISGFPRDLPGSLIGRRAGERVARCALQFHWPPPPPDAHSAFAGRHNRRRGPDARITATMADDFVFNEGLDFDVSDDERSGPPQAAWDFSGAHRDYPLHLRCFRFSDATRLPRFSPLREASLREPFAKPHQTDHLSHAQTPSMRLNASSRRRTPRPWTRRSRTL